MSKEKLDQLGIDAERSVYTKKDTSDKNLYYQSGNDIVRVSTDTPWIKQKQAPNNWALDDNNWTSDVNVCKEWESKLNGLFDKQNGALKGFIWNDNVTIKINNDKYVLENWNTKIALDKDILAGNFCGKTNIEDKMKIVSLAVDLNNLKFGKIGDNIQWFQRRYATQQSKGYWLDATQEGNFISFYNRLFDYTPQDVL